MNNIIRFPNQQDDPRDILRAALEDESLTGIIMFVRDGEGSLRLNFGGVTTGEICIAATLLTAEAQALVLGDDDAPEGAAI